MEQEFRGEKLFVKTPVMECKKCGWHFLTDDQADNLVQRTVDRYREKHGLLTSDQIKGYRMRLGLSQCEFAERLSVGEASLKRWETCHVQDKSSDALIRLKAKELIRERELDNPLQQWLHLIWQTKNSVSSVGPFLNLEQGEFSVECWKPHSPVSRSQSFTRRSPIYEDSLLAPAA